MKSEKLERPLNIANMPLVTAILEADRKAWWLSKRGTYNSELLRRIGDAKRFRS